MEKELLLELGKKAIVMFGFTYFSLAVTTQNFVNIVPPLLASGLYFFTELARIYKVQNINSVQRLNKKKLTNFHFLI